MMVSGHGGIRMLAVFGRGPPPPQTHLGKRNVDNLLEVWGLNFRLESCGLPRGAVFVRRKGLLAWAKMQHIDLTPELTQKDPPWSFAFLWRVCMLL